MSTTPIRRVGSVLVAAATIVVLVAVAVGLFFNPIWIAFEQDRTGAPALLGFTPDQTRSVTNSILAEFVVGPGTFAVRVNGGLVLNDRERGHMADVRGVVSGFAILALSAVAVLVVAARAARSPRTWIWRAVFAGAGTLAAAVVVAGVFAVLFFDAAFELFHRLLFPAGSYSFDPTAERLVQLFPMAFWFETSAALVAALLGLSLALAAIARRRLPRSVVRISSTSAVQPT